LKITVVVYVHSVSAQATVVDLAHMGAHVVGARSAQVRPHVASGVAVGDYALLVAHCAAVGHGCL
jgi:hypothetical protein